MISDTFLQFPFCPQGVPDPTRSTSKRATIDGKRSKEPAVVKATEFQQFEIFKSKNEQTRQ